MDVLRTMAVEAIAITTAAVAEVAEVAATVEAEEAVDTVEEAVEEGVEDGVEVEDETIITLHVSTLTVRISPPSLSWT